MAGKVTANNLDLHEQYAKAAVKTRFVVIDSSAATGGGASETLTFTGLEAADTIIACHQVTAGASGTAITEYDTQAANSLKVYWTADPGAGAVVRVVVARE